MSHVLAIRLPASFLRISYTDLSSVVSLGPKEMSDYRQIFDRLSTQGAMDRGPRVDPVLLCP
jgi:hypothetical protein